LAAGKDCNLEGLDYSEGESPDLIDRAASVIDRSLSQNFCDRKNLRIQKVEQALVDLEAGIAFLDMNKTRDGVITTESGLQYEILVEGTGPKPADTDNVTVHYHGTLIDGTVFDSSVDRGEPASFPVGGVIPGWVEALQLMPVGSKWKLFIPTDTLPAHSADWQLFWPELLSS